MIDSAYNVIRPTKTSDAEGGSTEGYYDKHVIYGAIVVHENETTMHVGFHDDVKVGDIIEVEEDDA